MIQIAVYGKGGIGKSTISANLSAALASSKKTVLQIGCDPKHDSTRLLLEGEVIPTVLDYIRETPQEAQELNSLVFKGYMGVACVETGGPKPGVGCAGRGILSSFETLKRLNLKASSFDVVLYDVLGDVVCGGFAVPLRKEYADAVFLVTSGEYMALYAANNILRGIKNFEDTVPRVAGIIFNGRGGTFEEERVFTFSRAVGLPVLVSLARDEIFAEAEKVGKTLAEAFPTSVPAGIFRKLAEYIEILDKDRSRLFPANPLEDLELEALILKKQKTENVNLSHSFLLTLDKKSATEPETFNPEKNLNSENLQKRSVSTQNISYPNCSIQDDSIQDDSIQDDSIQDDSIQDDSIQNDSTQNDSTQKVIPSRPPLYGCAFSGAVSATFQVTDAATVLHGPRSCTHITADALVSSFLSGRDTSEISSLEKQPFCLLSTDLEEGDIIFGGLEKLEKKIEEALQGGWKTVFVVNTCPGGIIGDDVRIAVSRIQPRFPEARIIHVPVEGTFTGDFSTGLFEGYKKVAELVDPSVRPEKGLVNVIGEGNFSLKEEEKFLAIEKLLNELGCRVNCRFLKGANTHSLRDLKKAEINLLACDDPETRSLQEYLSKHFELEFFELPFPVGFKESSIWIKTLAKRLFLEKDLCPFLQEQKETYINEIRKYVPSLAGKRVLLVNYSENIGWVIDTIQDLGMKILKIGVPESCTGKKAPAFLQNEESSAEGDFPVEGDFPAKRDFLVEGDYTEEKRIKDTTVLKPDLVLSTYVPSVPEEGVHYDTIPFSPKVGFLSGLELAKRWSALLRLPVTEGWKADGGEEN